MNSPVPPDRPGSEALPAADEWSMADSRPGTELQPAAQTRPAVRTPPAGDRAPSADVVPASQALPVRSDLIAELAGRLDQLDQLLGRLEDAERQAADAGEYLRNTRRWQEETVRTIQEERARMRQHQHALQELAERVRAALYVLMANHRTLPREVHELAVELHVLESAGFVARRAGRGGSQP